MMAHRRVAVTERSQVAQARAVAQECGRSIGLSEEDVHRAGLVTTELATNLVKHAGTGGEVLLRSDASPGAPFVEILAIDRGPGITDIAGAFRDGHSSAGSPGTGLGAIRRISDAFDLYTSRPTGTVMLCHITAGRRAAPTSAFTVGSVSVPVTGEDVCGDGWSVSVDDRRAVIAVADGLGHGPQAREAARAVLGSLDGHEDSSCRILLERMHAGSRHTRGAAASVACLGRGEATLQFAGVGNVSGVVLSAASQRQMVSSNGTLGHQARGFREFTYPWDSGALLVMHSDGLATHWKLDAYPGLRERHPSVVAAVLYRDFSRQRDDVTVVVAREAA